MKTLARQLRLLGDLLTDPRRAFTALGTAPPLASILVVLGALQAALWVAQSFLLESVTGPDEVAAAGTE